MHALVIGGSGSGKSAFAESLLLSLPAPRYYIATMENDGPAAERRISRHRALRHGKGILTRECPRGLHALSSDSPGALRRLCGRTLPAAARGKGALGTGAVHFRVRRSIFRRRTL